MRSGGHDALKWSRVRLVFSILTCEGLFATLRERLQYLPGPRRSLSAARKTQEEAPVFPRHFDYAGAMHVHSTYSDGVGTVGEVAEAANRAGLDFVVFCDHSNLDALAESGWHGRTLVLVGTEVTTDTGHLLALDVPPSYLPAPDDALAAQRLLLEQGGIGFVALPCDLKDHWRDFGRRLPAIGLEVFNLSAIARAKINLPAIAMIWQRYKSHRPQRAFHFVAARPSRELRLWDSLMTPDGPQKALQPVVGIASLDAHGVMKIARRSYQIPTYEDVFRTLRTHVVLPTALSHRNESSPIDQARVHEALAAGRCYMSYDNYGDPTGFIFESKSGEAISAMMGDSLSFSDARKPESRLRLQVHAPRARCFIRLFRNGRFIAGAHGGYLEHGVKAPGAYRVEVFLYRWRVGRLLLGVKPWIFSNPIYVHPAAVTFDKRNAPGNSVAPRPAVHS